MPARIAAPPSTCGDPTASWNTAAPVTAPTSGSRLTNAPATSAGTCDCAQANSQNASAVPVSASARTAITGVAAVGTLGAPSVSAANGSAASPPPASWTAVTAPASRPRSSRGCSTMKPAEPVTDASTSRSPVIDVPAPPPPATRPTPASATSDPAHVVATAVLRPASAAITATRTGTAPTISAA
ncbi:MAG TPA: hypothetical protein VFM58_17215, partial [Solirubrobacteraceae bacterium]|nr:hypothetical protein [Solirubrobacteraceae bacterium]